MGNGSNSSQNKDYAFYTELLNILNEKYRGVSQINRDRKKMAEGRLKLLLTSFAISVAISKSFLDSGIFSFNIWSKSLLIGFAILTTGSLLYTVWKLWNFWTPEEMETIDVSEEKWGASNSRSSNPQHVDKLLDGLIDQYSDIVSNNVDTNNELAEDFTRSSIGLVIYFLSLSLTLVILIVVEL